MCSPEHGRSSGHGIGAVVHRGPASVGVLIHARAKLGFASLLVRGAQDRSGGVDHGGVANRLALLIFDSFHGLQLGHAVGELRGTGDEGLDIVLDSRLAETVNLLNKKNRPFIGSCYWGYLCDNVMLRI